MPERRKPRSEITPQYEDRGIFKNPLVKATVEVVPLYTHNMRNDLVFKAFHEGETEIDLVIAGRRAPLAGPLVQRLRDAWQEANKIAAQRGRPAETDQVRVKVKVEGAWRPRFQQDTSGWQYREHQLYAARWMMADKSGEAKEYGLPRAF